jgi:hypothetical protein
MYFINNFNRTQIEIDIADIVEMPAHAALFEVLPDIGRYPPREPVRDGIYLVLRAEITRIRGQDLPFFHLDHPEREAVFLFFSWLLEFLFEFFRLTSISFLIIKPIISNKYRC